jgi:hypothetical protein
VTIDGLAQQPWFSTARITSTIDIPIGLGPKGLSPHRRTVI